MTTQTTPNDRSTEFRAVEGNPTEQYSGGALLVAAYAALWVIIFAWVALVWRKQRGLDTRLADLERVLDKAAAQGESGGPKAGAKA
jgi:CcmD family protein